MPRDARRPEAQAGQGNTVKITNVDTSDQGMLTFLERTGFTPWVDQFEMAVRL